MTLADLPPLENAGPPASPFEFMPAWRLYLPLAPHIAALVLRHGPTTLTAANPAIPGGGLVGESKTQILDLVRGTARAHIAPYARLHKGGGLYPPAETDAVLKDAGVTFPAVAKPDMSCRGAGVRILPDRAALNDYWSLFPDGADMVVQSKIELMPEAGIFYLREPGTDTPWIFSLTLKYPAQVMGDGRSSLEQLIRADVRAEQTAEVYLNKPGLDLSCVPASGEPINLSFAGNHCRGAVFRDGADHITTELTTAIHGVVESIPDFHFGRLDLRFESLEDLKRGMGFKVIEINGVGSEATHIWDNRFTLPRAREVLKQQYTHAWEFGAAMRKRGARPTSLITLVRMWLRERQLTKNYPTSD